MLGTYRGRRTIASMVVLVLALAGVALTVQGVGGRAGSLSGDLLALVMTVGIAAMTVTLRRYRQVAMLPTACLSNLLGSLVSLAFARPLAVGHLDLAYLALFGFVQMTLGLTLFTIGFASPICWARS